jgi:nucleoid-associated protein YgaU
MTMTTTDAGSGAGALPAAPTAEERTVTKAKLVISEPKASGGKDIETIEFPFNPKDFSLTRKANWTSDPAKKAESPPEYLGAQPTEISVEMFLDESEDAKGDISKTVDKLLTCLDPHTGTGDSPSAPHVTFFWGSAIRFRGIVTSVAVNYTLFRGTGTPIRGRATVTIKEMGQPAAAQNPTSGSPGGYRTHLMRAGDTLASVAYAEYGDAGRWRLLADVNRIDDPSRIPAGTSLLVPGR